MAYTLQGAMSFSLRDAAGVRGSLHVPMLLDPTQTGTALAAAWNTQAALLDAITTCQVFEGKVVIEIQGGGLTFTPKSPTPTVGSFIERGGVVDYPSTVDGDLYGSVIPGIATPPLLASGKDIDETSSVFTAYIAPFETPVTVWRATNSQFQTLGAHVDSFVSFRKHRRQRTRLSKQNP